MRGFKFPREFYLPKDVPLDKVEFEGGVAYKYDQLSGGSLKYFLVIFLGKQSKPINNYYYRSIDSREQALARQIEASKKSAEFKAKRKLERKLSNAGVEVGDIFVSSGGYDQTNVEALQVVEKLGGSMVKVKLVGFEESKEDFKGAMSNNVKPIKDNFLEGEYYESKGGVRKVINGYIKGTWGSASKWDGKRAYYHSWYG